MKFVIGAAVALLATVSTVSAADLPVKSAGYAPPAPYSWGGFYLGGHVGYGVMWSYLRDLDDEFDNENTNTRRHGFLGGVHAGYNWQFGSAVVGVEADFAGTTINGTKDFNVNAGTPEHNEASLDWFGTFRGRAGLAFDRSLFFITAGAAYAKIDQRHFETNAAGAVTSAFSSNKVHWGLAVGGGVEHAFTNNWSARLDAMYVTLADTDRLNNDVLAAGTDQGAFGNDFVVVRLGASYKFGR
jgi:outer membrane immunogenic protein